VTGRFDPTEQIAVWPSTGNYARGGAFVSALLGCEAIAILPEGMSDERFELLHSLRCEVVKTPGSESNVKEIFDKCDELRQSGRNLIILNQFEEFWNYLWHREVTGSAMIEVVEKVMGGDHRYRGLTIANGSAGTIGAGDFLKERYPSSKISASEALQCPTMLSNGAGAHRIEGIGDKHVPWIHNVKNTDVVMGIDDEAAIQVFRLFNEPAGIEYLAYRGVSPEILRQLPLMGISGVANLLSAIKFSKYYELGEKDSVLTVFTDSSEIYQSRLRSLRRERGAFSDRDAAAVYHRYLLGAGTDYVHELSYHDRKRIHNLKYFTWVEQQGKNQEEMQAQWSDGEYWTNVSKCADELDLLIEDFNERTGVLKNL
jgi:cysteine synthase